MILNSRYLENRSLSRSLIPYETTKRCPPRWIDGNYHLGCLRVTSTMVTLGLTRQPGRFLLGRLGMIFHG